MGAWRFRAVDAGGRTQSGLVEAASAAAARAALRGRGLLPIEVAAGPAPQRKAEAGAAPRAAGGPRLPMATLVLVTRQMATLLASGLRVEDALSAIARGLPARPAAILLSLRASVMEGRSLADALGGFPRVFSEFYRASVRAGEQAGRLDQVMRHLAGFVENRARNRQTVQLALLYPALLAVVSLAIITSLLVFVVPDIVRVFGARGGDLPVLTRALIGTSAVLRDWGLALALGGALAGLAAARWLAVPANRLRWDGWTARARPTARLVRQMNAAQFAGTLATLVQSGVPLVEALRAAAEVTPNAHIRARVAEATVKVQQGMSLTRAMEEAAVFPPILTAMVASGEASGTLGPALEHAAADQQRDLDAWVRAVVALVEPAILLVMGGLVMVLVLAILLPIVAINGLAGG
jgi:general secretion pathway protein F